MGTSKASRELLLRVEGVEARYCSHLILLSSDLHEMLLEPASSPTDRNGHRLATMTCAISSSCGRTSFSLPSQESCLVFSRQTRGCPGLQLRSWAVATATPLANTSRRPPVYPIGSTLRRPWLPTQPGY
jgi:hypothetical protein